jgi:hypothetical protein
VFTLQLAGNDSLFFSLADLSVVRLPFVLKPIRAFFQKFGSVSLDRLPAAAELFCGFTDF